MKLTTKLLPVATLGAVASVVVPLATSCGSSGNWINGTDKVDTTGWKQAAGKEYKKVEDSDKVEIVKNYLTEVANDKTIAENDFKFYIPTEYDFVKSWLDKLVKKVKEDDEYPIESYTINKLSGYISNISVKEANSKHYISYVTGLKTDISIAIKGKISFGEIEEDLSGNLTLKADLKCNYNSILGDVYLKGESTQDPLSMLLLDIQTYPHSMFYSNLMYMVEDPKTYPSLDDTSFSYDGSASLRYINNSDQKLNLGFDLSGGKSFTKIDDVKDWDPLTTVCMMLTGQWYSYYLDSLFVTPAK